MYVWFLYRLEKGLLTQYVLAANRNQGRWPGCTTPAIQRCCG